MKSYFSIYPQTLRIHVPHSGYMVLKAVSILVLPFLPLNLSTLSHHQHPVGQETLIKWGYNSDVIPDPFNCQKSLPWHRVAQGSRSDPAGRMDPEKRITVHQRFCIQIFIRRSVLYLSKLLSIRDSRPGYRDKLACSERLLTVTQSVIHESHIYIETKNPA